jgi:hypothetical protein
MVFHRGILAARPRSANTTVPLKPIGELRAVSTGEHLADRHPVVDLRLVAFDSRVFDHDLTHVVHTEELDSVRRPILHIGPIQRTHLATTAQLTVALRDHQRNQLIASQSGHIHLDSLADRWPTPWRFHCECLRVEIASSRKRHAKCSEQSERLERVVVAWDLGTRPFGFGIGRHSRFGGPDWSNMEADDEECKHGLAPHTFSYCNSETTQSPQRTVHDAGCQQVLDSAAAHEKYRHKYPPGRRATFDAYVEVFFRLSAARSFPGGWTNFSRCATAEQTLLRNEPRLVTQAEELVRTAGYELDDSGRPGRGSKWWKAS